MIRALTLLCILGISRNVAGNIFQDNVLYIYNYTGEIRTGRNDSFHPHFSGFGFQAQLEIFRKGIDYIHFKFNHVKIGRDQKEASFSDQRFTYHEPETSENKLLASKLETPFRVHYQDGTFKYFNNPTPDEINFRKAIISLFEISYNPGDENKENFTVLEDCLFGKCSSQYIRTSPTDLQKIRLYSTCKYRPYFFSSIMGYQCHLSIQQKIEPLIVHDRALYHFSLGTNAHHPLTLLSISAEGHVRFDPFTVNGQSFISEVRQELTFVNSVTGCTSCIKGNVPKFPEIRSLAFQFHQDVSEPVSLKQVYFPRMANKQLQKNHIVEILHLMESLPHKLKRSDQLADTLFTILGRLRQLDYDKFVDLFNNCVKPTLTSTAEEHTKWLLLLELIPYVGTNPSVIFMISDLIETNKVDKEMANELVAKFSFHVKEPTFELLQFFLNFTKSTLKEKHYKTKLWRTAWLSVGSLIQRGCVDTLFSPLRNGQLFMTPDECDRGLEILFDEFNHRSTGLGIEYLRAIGNTFMFPKAYNFFVDLTMSGMKKKNNESVGEGENQSENNQEYSNSHIRIRNVAIAGLIPFMHAKPEEIASIVYDIFHNELEDDVIRIHAYDVLMWSRPTREFFFHLIPIVNHPENVRISSYIYNTVHTFSKSRDPARQRLVRLAKEVLPLLKPPKDYDTLMYSTDKIFTAYNGRYNFGHANQFYSIPSRKSIIPREIYFHESMNFMNYKFDIIEFGYIAESERPFEKFAEMFHPDLLSLEELNVSDEAHSLVEWYMRHHLHQILFNVKQEADPRTQFDRLIGHKNINLHNIIYDEVELAMANTLGFPVVISFRSFVSFHGIGNGTFTSLSGQGFSGKIDSEFSLNVVIKAKLVVEGISSKEYGYEVATYSSLNFPLKGTLDVKSEEKRIKVKYALPTNVYNILKFETIPGAIFPVEPYKFPSQRSWKLKNQTISIGHEYFGAGLDLHISTSQVGFLFGVLETFRETAANYSSAEYTELDKYYAGIRAALGYAFLNPQALPFHCTINTVPASEYPTEEFHVDIRKESKQSEFTDLQYDDGTSVSLETTKLQLEVIGNGTAARKWNFEFLRTFIFPNSDVLKDFILQMTSPVNDEIGEHKKVYENIADLFYRYKLLSDHTFHIMGMVDGSGERNHLNTNANLGSNLPFYNPAIVITNDGAGSYTYVSELFEPEEELSSLTELVFQRIWTTAFHNFYSTCVVSSSYIYTFDELLHKPQFICTDAFKSVFEDCINQDIHVEYRNVSGDVAVKIKYQNSKNESQRLEVFHPSSSGGVRIFLNDVPIFIEDYLPASTRWTRTLDNGKMELYLHSDILYITSSGYDVSIVVDKSMIVIMASNVYKGRQCGLCGQMDGEAYS